MKKEKKEEGEAKKKKKQSGMEEEEEREEKDKLLSGIPTQTKSLACDATFKMLLCHFKYTNCDN